MASARLSWLSDGDSPPDAGGGWVEDARIELPSAELASLNATSGDAARAAFGTSVCAGRTKGAPSRTTTRCPSSRGAS